MIEFVGRRRELGLLSGMFAKVEAAAGGARPGQCLLMRGRRRIGKSSLVEAFVEQAQVPALFFTASRASSDIELASFSRSVTRSTLPERAAVAEAAPGDWSSALNMLADVLPDDQPSIVVIDEVPYLVDRVDAFEGMLQRAWDRELSRKPVLLILIGSDISMMEALNSYDRPFHQRGTEMVLGPLNPADVGEMLRLDPAEAFDAALVTGGLPLVCAAWQPGTGLWDFLGQELRNPVSPLLVSADRSLGGEFPEISSPRSVLTAIGSGERTFANIARAAGGISHVALTRALDVLVHKGIVSVDLPVSTTPSKERRYRITDPYLRFWLTFVEPNRPEIDRFRGDLVTETVKQGWTSWRGRAVEPLLRESLARLLPSSGIAAARVIGAYWTRSNGIEIDIVGADRDPVAKQLHFIGSIKWLERSPFDNHDLIALQRHRGMLTDTPVPLVAISRSGVDTNGLDASFGPAELLEAWRLPAPLVG